MYIRKRLMSAYPFIQFLTFYLKKWGRVERVIFISTLNKVNKFFRVKAVLMLWLLPIINVQAKIIKQYTIELHQACSTEQSIAVIPARELPYLLGEHLSQIRLYRYSLSDSPSTEQATGFWQEIGFQIDQRDEQGRFILDEALDSEVHQPVLGIRDEIVFRMSDAGERIETHSSISEQNSLIEIALKEFGTDKTRWLYINTEPESKTIASLNKTKKEMETRLVYSQNEDSIISPVYKIGFNTETPFLIDSFQWLMPMSSQWSDDISDMMKIRHYGQFLGFPFKRSQEDYSSHVVAVKKGLLRVIRRTENRVKVLWKLKTPGLYIDYIMMPDGFVMDTMIDIPFKLSFFFSELETVTTMDWNPESELSKMEVYTKKPELKVIVDGVESIPERLFNQYEGTEFSVRSAMGVFDVNLDIPDKLPIKPYLYIKDSIEELDEPEKYPGQFGNVGFRTTGWEEVDNELYHLKFSVCIKPHQAKNVQQLEKTQ